MSCVWWFFVPCCERLIYCCLVDVFWILHCIQKVGVSRLNDICWIGLTLKASAACCLEVYPLGHVINVRLEDFLGPIIVEHPTLGCLIPRSQWWNTGNNTTVNHVPQIATHHKQFQKHRPILVCLIFFEQFLQRRSSHSRNLSTLVNMQIALQNRLVEEFRIPYKGKQSPPKPGHLRIYEKKTTPFRGLCSSPFSLISATQTSTLCPTMKSSAKRPRGFKHRHAREMGEMLFKRPEECSTRSKQEARGTNNIDVSRMNHDCHMLQKDTHQKVSTHNSHFIAVLPPLFQAPQRLPLRLVDISYIVISRDVGHRNLHWLEPMDERWRSN